jgi:hypothetical protein
MTLRVNRENLDARRCLQLLLPTCHAGSALRTVLIFLERLVAVRVCGAKDLGRYQALLTLDVPR